MRIFLDAARDRSAKSNVDAIARVPPRYTGAMIANRLNQTKLPHRRAPESAMCTASSGRAHDSLASQLPMKHTEEAWESRLADLWRRLDEIPATEFVGNMRHLTAERPEGDPIGLFELGAAYDSTGSPSTAVSLYESALQAGLTGVRRRRARIQMASSLRNLGMPQQAVDMLVDELNQSSDELDQAVAAFLALALADLGRERDALSISLEALSRYLPRYNRSLARYAAALKSTS